MPHPPFRATFATACRVAFAAAIASTSLAAHGLAFAVNEGVTDRVSTTRCEHSEDGRRKLEAMKYDGFIAWSEADMLSLAAWLGL